MSMIPDDLEMFPPLGYCAYCLGNGEREGAVATVAGTSLCENHAVIQVHEDSGLPNEARRAIRAKLGLRSPTWSREDVG